MCYVYNQWCDILCATLYYCSAVVHVLDSLMFGYVGGVSALCYLQNCIMEVTMI
jgi:hypothetical protein